MTPLFEDFWNEITSDDIWFEQLKMRHPKKDWHEAANDIYLDYLAKGNFPDVKEARRHLNNKLIYKPTKDDVYRKPNEPIVKEDYHTNPLTDEEKKSVDELLNTFKNQLSSTAKPVPQMSKDEIQVLGAERLPKGTGYKPASQEILQMRERLKQAAREFYKDVAVSFSMSEVSGFQTYFVGDYEIYARSEQDAQTIYDNAKQQSHEF